MILIFFLCFFLQTVNSANILGVFMTPSFSHQIIFQPIWKELSLRGHKVTVLTTHPLNDEKLVNLTEIDLSYTSTIINKNRNNSALFMQKRTSFDETKRMGEIYEMITHIQLSDPEVQKLINSPDAHFDLILVEYLFPTMFIFKDIFNCPMIGITSLSLIHHGHKMIGNPDNPAHHPMVILPFSTNSNIRERFTSVVYYLYSQWKFYELTSKMDVILQKYIGNKKVRSLSEICLDFDLVIMNSNLAISNARPLVPNLIDISGIHIKKPQALPMDLQDYLDKATEGAIYISFGSNTKSTEIPREKLIEIIACLSNLPQKILWKFEGEFTGLPSNFLVRKWFPQQDILAHPNIKIFITQGGIQSMDEAIFRKVPLLIIPLLGDQKYNAHHMTRRGAALTLEIINLNRDSLKEAIDDLLNNPKYRMTIEKMSEVAKDQIVEPLEKAVWWIEYVLRHDGAEHLKYSGRDVPFYKFYWLDIIALTFLSLTLVFVLSIIILKFTFKKFKLILNSSKIKKS